VTGAIAGWDSAPHNSPRVQVEQRDRCTPLLALGLIEEGLPLNDKAELTALLREEFDRWEEVLSSMQEEEITAPNLIAHLSIKDTVAHLTAWQKISVARLEAARVGRQPEYPPWHAEFDPETDEELDAINTLIFESYREQSWSDIHSEWRNRFLGFLKLAETIPEEDLVQGGKYAWLKEYPLSAVLLGSYEHHKEHREGLVAHLDGQGTE